MLLLTTGELSNTDDARAQYSVAGLVGGGHWLLPEQSCTELRKGGVKLEHFQSCEEYGACPRS